jgi:predicted sulfurtransferase
VGGVVPQGLLEKRGGAKETLQLAGGIHRYLESFPDGGAQWKGANLVFDQRHVQVSQSETETESESETETDSYGRCWPQSLRL